MLNRALIKTWTYSNLTRWLTSLSTTEDDSFDLKNHYNENMNPAKIRKCFSSFANTRGGFVFFGINDSKQAIGCINDSEVSTKLNRILTSNLDPKIKWEIVHIVEVQPRTNPARAVYVTEIKESIFVNKPHIADGKIYIRESGECKEVVTNNQLRQLFFTSPFYPEHIGQLEYELRKIKNYQYESSTINVIYLMNLRRFIEESLTYEKNRKRKQNLLKLNNNFVAISKLMDEIGREQSKQIATQGILPTTNSQIVTKLYDSLSLEVNKFISLFKVIYYE